jgi:aminoglycoside phosphotransferase (APT) family kinase protein
MTALEVEDADGLTRRMIVRRPNEKALERNPRAAEDEFRLLQAAQRLGLAMPRPYHLDQSGEILPAPYLVIEYVEGEPDFSPADLADHARQLATHLARIHSADCSVLSFLPRQTARCAETLGARTADVVGLWQSPLTTSEEWTRVSLVADNVVRIRGHMCHSTDSATPLADVERALDVGRIRSALASHRSPPQRNAPALLHGDYWPGNVLWQDGELVAVIDWEDAKLGDPLADLAISRLDIAWILGTAAMTLFGAPGAMLVAVGAPYRV